ncbi:MAG: Ig-like domain-containing protein, partial [Anaerolineaceae bacterium]
MSKQQASASWTTRVWAWGQPKMRQRRWLLGSAGVLAALVVFGVGAWWLSSGDGSSKPAIPEPPGFAVSPEGDDVPRLAPIKVTFASAPTERSPEKLLIAEPAMKGTYTWLTDRTVLFQPEFPGMLRGSTYTVKVGARPETGLMEDVEKQFTVTGLLTVQQAIPGDDDSEVPLNAQIIVQFSRSVAPLTMLSEQRKDPVVAFEPALEGAGEWLNTSIYRFVPTNLQPYTMYKLKVAKGLSSAADGVLREDFAWSFRTIGPAVAGVSPDAATEFASLLQPVVVTFNQPMDSSAALAITLKSSTGIAIPGSVAWSEKNTVVMFTPSQPLVHQTTYTATIPKGLKGATGGETAEERLVSFTTVPLPAVTRTEPARGATDAQRYGVSLTFASPMNAESLEGKLSVSGFTAEQLDGNLSADERSLRANVILKPSSSYTVALAAGAKDRYGEVMGGYTFSFTTGALPSSVTLALPGYSASATYSASVEPILYFHTTNMPSASFQLYPLTDSEGQQMLHGNLGGKSFVPSQQALRQWTEPVNAAKDEIVLNSTSLSGGGPLPKGYYFLQSSGQYASTFAFAVVDSVVVSKVSNDELAVWVLDHDNGQPLPGVTVRASGPELSSPAATTDGNGLASFKIGSPTLGKNTDRSYSVVVSGGGHFGFASTRWQQGTAPYQLNLPTEYYAREWVGHVYTDRPIYRPGEKVEYKGVVRADDDAQYSVPGSNPPLQFVIMNARGQEVRRDDVTTNGFGTFAGTFELPADATVGDYSISLQLKGLENFFNVITGNSFLVAEFRKPEFQVEVKTGKPSYVNGDSIDVQASATFFFGGKVADAGVEWAAMGVPFQMSVKGYERFSFSDYDYWKQAVYKQPVRSTGTATTGADGIASFQV